MLLMKIKKKLHEEFPLKLIVMTATVDAHQIQEYFHEFSTKTIQLEPQDAHPIVDYYIDDINGQPRMHDNMENLG